MRKSRKAKDTGEENPKSKTGMGELFDLPGSVTTGEMQIELAGNTEAVISGCTGVLEYNPETIRLMGKKLSVRFCGRGLGLKALTQNSAIVHGYILSMEFVLV